MAVITLDDYKAWATIKSPNQDTQLTPLVEAASAAVESFLGYKFTTDTSGVDTPKRVTKKYPLAHRFQDEFLLPDMDVSILTISVYSTNHYTTINPAVELLMADLDPSEYHVEEDIGLLKIFRRMYEGWGIEVVYDTSKTPDEAVKLATCLLVDYWKDKDFNTTVTQGGQSVSHVSTRVLPKHIEAILNMYRQI
ncbi:hypothetical protein [Vibrio phage VCPH]|nr:hypothetical protein [Vibrio phage VCPH]